MLLLLLTLSYLFSFALALQSSPLQDAIDLTHASSPTTPVWPGHTRFNFTILVRGTKPYGTYVESNAFSQAEHFGTHMDAPVHFAKGKWRVEEIPFERLAGPAVVVNVEKAASKDPDYQLSTSDLEDWESQHGEIPEGAVVLMYSGHGRHFNDSRRYLGFPAGVDAKDPQWSRKMHFPGFHPEAARWLVENRNIVGVGADTISFDHGQSQTFEAHKIFCGNNIWGLENVANLDLLEPNGYTVYAMVYKLQEGSGAPARVFAVPSSSEFTLSSPGGQALNKSVKFAALMTIIMTRMTM